MSLDTAARLDQIHWPMAAVLLLGIVPKGVSDLGEALLSEGADNPPATRS